MISPEFASSVSVIQRSVSDFAAALMIWGLRLKGTSLRLTSNLKLTDEAFTTSRQLAEMSNTSKELPKVLGQL
jgi:hypothetical protein